MYGVAPTTHSGHFTYSVVKTMMVIVKFTVLKGSFGSHLGLRNLVHARHYVLDCQCFEFFGDVLPATTLAGPGEPNNPHYAFLAAYWDAKTSER